MEAEWQEMKVDRARLNREAQTMEGGINIRANIKTSTESPAHLSPRTFLAAGRRCRAAT